MRDNFFGKLQAGDDAAWEEFYASFRPLVTSYVNRFIQQTGLPHSLRDDLVQEAFIYIWKKIRTGKPIDPNRLTSVVTRWITCSLADYARGKSRKFNNTLLSLDSSPCRNWK